MFLSEVVFHFIDKLHAHSFKKPQLCSFIQTATTLLIHSKSHNFPHSFKKPQLCCEIVNVFQQQCTNIHSAKVIFEQLKEKICSNMQLRWVVPNKTGGLPL